MPVKIRLSRKGRKKAPFYHIVVADSRAPRDGKFIEKIGSYNPLTSPATIDLNRDAAYDWIMKGAQPTETTRAILRFKGVFYKKHLQRGVAKGAVSQEDADRLYLEYIDAKEAKIAERVEQEAKKKEEFWKNVSGKPGKKPVDLGSADEGLQDFQNVEVDAAEAPAPEEAPAEAVAEAPAEVVAEAPAAEPVAETPAPEAPAVEEATAEAPAAEEPAAEEATAEAPTAEETPEDSETKDS